MGGDTVTDYRKILSEVPDLAAQVAAGITPSAMLADGMPRGNEIPEAAGIGQLDRLQDIMAEIVASIDFWWKAQAEYLVLERPDLGGAGMKRTDFGFRYQRVVSDDPWLAAIDARRLVNILLGWWDELEGHPQWEYWIEDISASLVPAVERLEARIGEVTPRRCPRCREYTMWANTDKHHARCANPVCDFVMSGRAWMNFFDASKYLDVTQRTIRNWVNAGEVDVRDGSNGREVEILECYRHKEMKRLRRLLQLENSPGKKSIEFPLEHDSLSA